MGKLKIILTVDYEVFGNGSGCVDRCVIDPSERMMQLCEKYNAKMTFFVDVCEYLAFKKVKESNKFKDGFDPAQKIDEQLKDIVKRGHDVQLHLHPQWLDYKYLGNNNWKLNIKYWRLPNVKLLGENAIYNLFKNGKDCLEGIIKKIKPDYCCNVFRAGALCIQPEEEILKVMHQLNFKIDSTVIAGMKFNDGTTFYDFTNAMDELPHWNILNNVKFLNKKGSLKEVPIFSASVPGIKVLKFKVLKILRKIPFKPIGCKQESNNHKKRSLLHKVFRSVKSQRRKFNFCDATPFEELKYMTEQAKSKYKDYLRIYNKKSV